MDSFKLVLILSCLFGCFGIRTVLGQNYSVTSILEDPYLIDNGDGTFSGFMVDLLDALSKKAGFSYDISLTPDGLYGTKSSMGEWNGMIGELLDGTEDVDIAAAPLIITAERRSAVPFTRPFHTVGHRIVIQKPVVEFHSLKVLFEPFSLQLWIMIIVICVIVSVLLFIVNKFSPSEWSKVLPEDDPTNARDSFAPKNAAFFVHSTLTLQGYKEAPRSPAGRILVTMWFSFIFFMVIAYISNLTAFLLARQPDKPVVPFKTWEEMTSQSSVIYGIKSQEYMYRKMKESKDTTMVQAIRNIETYGSMFNTYEEGIQKVRSSNGMYAAIVPVDEGSKFIENEPCDLMFVGATLVDMPYGIACKKQQDCNVLDAALVDVIQDGSMYRLRHKWLTPMSKCGSNKNDHMMYISKHETPRMTAKPLTIADTSLAFVVLLMGVVLCVVFLVVEVCVSRRRKGKMTRLNQEDSPNKGQDMEEGRLPDEQDKAPIATNEATNNID